MEHEIRSKYDYRANVQKIDSECLKWFLKEQRISISKLADKPEITVGYQTIYKWIRRGEMPQYLIEEICQALALETVCDMRENPELKCAEPVTTFMLKDKEEANLVKLHARIGIEVKIPKDVFYDILRKATSAEGIDDLDFDDATAAILIDRGVPAWDHYIPGEWLMEDARAAGVFDEKCEGVKDG